MADAKKTFDAVSLLDQVHALHEMAERGELGCISEDEASTVYAALTLLDALYKGGDEFLPEWERQYKAARRAMAVAS